MPGAQPLGPFYSRARTRKPETHIPKPQPPNQVLGQALYTTLAPLFSSDGGESEVTSEAVHTAVSLLSLYADTIHTVSGLALSHPQPRRAEQDTLTLGLPLTKSCLALLDACCSAFIQCCPAASLFLSSPLCTDQGGGTIKAHCQQERRHRGIPLSHILHSAPQPRTQIAELKAFKPMVLRTFHSGF